MQKKDESCVLSVRENGWQTWGPSIVRPFSCFYQLSIFSFKTNFHKTKASWLPPLLNESLFIVLICSISNITKCEVSGLIKTNVCYKCRENWDSQKINWRIILKLWRGGMDWWWIDYIPNITKHYQLSVNYLQFPSAPAAPDALPSSNTKLGMKLLNKT